MNTETKKKLRHSLILQLKTLKAYLYLKYYVDKNPSVLKEDLKLICEDVNYTNVMNKLYKSQFYASICYKMIIQYISDKTIFKANLKKFGAKPILRNGHGLSKKLPNNWPMALTMLARRTIYCLMLGDAAINSKTIDCKKVLEKAISVIKINDEMYIAAKTLLDIKNN